MLFFGSKTLNLTATLSLLFHLALVHILSSSGGPKAENIPGSITLSEIVTVERKRVGTLRTRPQISQNIPVKSSESTPLAPAPTAHTDASTSGVDENNANHVATGQTDPYISEIVHAMNHAKKYPQVSIDNEEQGVVLLLVAVERSGKIRVLEILRGSGYARLDRAATDSVANIQKFDVLPERFFSPLLLKIPIRFTIHY